MQQVVTYSARRRSMATRLHRILLITVIAILVWPTLAPAQRPAVLVNPHVQGNGGAKTIQDGIDMVDAGGKVMILPGTYSEIIRIEKGLTLEPVGGESGPVIVEPPGVPTVGIEITTSQPVVIRGITVHSTGFSGIRGVGTVDLTIEGVTVVAVNPPAPPQPFSRLISAANDCSPNCSTPSPPENRARLTVRDSFLDGTVECVTYPAACGTESSPIYPEVYGIIVAGDVDAVLERNVIRRAGAACVLVLVRDDLAGETNVDILENDLDECHPRGRGGAIVVGLRAGNDPSSTRPLTATGQANIVGNTIHNSSGSCRTPTAINYQALGGQIERNRIEDVVLSCSAVGGARALPAGIWLGNRLNFYPPVDAHVQFNDIVGNAQAGLRVGPNMTAPISASCNWWGSASGPSVPGPGAGDAIVVEPGAATPVFTPWASATIAETDETTCTGGS